jgi:hypothetical protein
VEVYDLMLAFPGKDDRAEFTSLLFDHIALKHPSRIVLAAACHRLRCISKFRPAISEVLEQLEEVGYSFRYLKLFANLEVNLDKARAHLLRIEAQRAIAPPAKMPEQKPPTAPPRSRIDYLKQTELQRRKEEEARVAKARTEAAAAGLFEEESEPQARTDRTTQQNF